MSKININKPERPKVIGWYVPADYCWNFWGPPRDYIRCFFPLNERLWYWFSPSKLSTNTISVRIKSFITVNKQTNKQTLQGQSGMLLGGGEVAIFNEWPLRLVKPCRLWNVLTAHQKVKKLKHIPLTSLLCASEACCLQHRGFLLLSGGSRCWLFPTSSEMNVWCQGHSPPATHTSHSAITHHCYILYIISLTSSTPHISWFNKTKH